MKRSIVQYVLIALGLSAIVVLAVAGDRNAREHYSFYSTYDTGPNGYRAVYEVMRAAGLEVMRFERPLGLMDPRIHTLVVASNRADILAGASRSQFDAGDVHRLQNFVRSGGRLVLLEGSASNDLYAAFKLAAKRGNANATIARPSLAPIADVRFTGGVRDVVAERAVLVPFGGIAGAVPLLGSNAGVAAFVRRYGKGDVVAIAAPTVWSNGEIGRASNARFAYNVLAGRGLVAFDERIHGYALDKSFWAALPAPVHAGLLIVLGILVLWLVDANIRSVPALVADAPDERHASSYIAAMGTLLRRAHARGRGVVSFYDDALRRAGPRRDRPDVARALDELARLRAMPFPNDDALLRAAQIAARLRKDLG